MELLPGPLAPIILAGAFCAALLYGMALNRSAPSPARTVIKTAGLAGLSVVAALAGLPWLLVLALAASAVGDGLLAGPGERRFMAGVGAFALAHAAYVPLFIGLGAWQAPPDGTRLAAMALLLVVAVWLLAVVLWRYLGALRWPLTGYFLIILAMGFTALAMPGSVGGLAITAGAMAFVLSDMVLGIELFRLKDGSRWRSLTGPAIWVLYFGGQALIAWGVLVLSAGQAG